MVQEIQLTRNIIALRKEKGWTQEHFAEKVGVTRTAVAKWETGSCMDIYKYYEDNANEYNIIDDADGVYADMVYDAGVEAAEKGDYSSAIRLMEEALMRGMYQATGALMQVYSEILDIYMDYENMVDYSRTYLTVAKKMQAYGKICEKILIGRSL